MYSGLLNWEYTTNDAANAIINYVDALSLQDPGPGLIISRDSRTNSITQIIWPPGVSNPVPYDYDPTLATSGFIEDISQVRAQLGRRLDPITGALISGSIWNTDYEYHLEYGTMAMLQPAIALANNILRPALQQVNDLITILTADVNKPWEINIHKGSDYSESFTVIYPNGWTGTFNHWPRFQYMTSLQRSSAGFNETYPDNEYRLGEFPKTNIQVLFDPTANLYRVNILDTASLTGAYEGKLLVW